MAQALAACQQIVPDRSVHEFGCHFLRGGNVDEDIIFQANILMSGGSFTVVHIRAEQTTPGNILSMTASFMKPEEGLQHQWTHRKNGLRPEWLSPEECKSTTELMKPYLDKIPPSMRELYANKQPIEVRPTTFNKPWDAQRKEPTRALWIKAREKLPNDQRVQERLLTYISDWGLLETSVFPHDVGMWNPKMQMASLSHSLKFHRDFNIETEWLCHAMHSPCSGGGRGFAVGEFWNEKGELVASTSQEGLIRLRK